MLFFLSAPPFFFLFSSFFLLLSPSFLVKGGNKPIRNACQESSSVTWFAPTSFFQRPRDGPHGLGGFFQSERSGGGGGLGGGVLVLFFSPKNKAFTFTIQILLLILLFPLKILVGLRVLFSQQTVCGDLLLNNNGKRISI